MSKHQKIYNIAQRIIKIVLNTTFKPKRFQHKKSTKINVFTLIKNLKNRVVFGNFTKRRFINFISDKISNPKIILEIGSHDAIQSIEFSKLYPKAKIYAFECIPQCVKECIKNTKNYKNIEVVPYAVFNKNEKMSFHVSTYIKASGLFKSTEEYCQPLKSTQKEIVVDAIRIDTWAKEKRIKKIDLVWIDIQGAEYEAFEGIGKLLSDVQAIYTEVEVKELYTGQKLMKDVSRLLNKNGLSLLKYTESSKDRWGNAIYINKQIIS